MEIEVYNWGTYKAQIDASASENQVLGIIQSGKDNGFPAKLLEYLRYSPTSVSCLSASFKFVRGGGFEMPEFGYLRANSNEKISNVDAKLAKDQTYFHGCYLLVNYNREGKIVSVRHMPFESMRITSVDLYGYPLGFRFNPYWGIGSGYDYSEQFLTKYYPFNPDPDVIASEIDENGKHPGQVIMWKEESPQTRVYPVPAYVSAINWINCDSEIAQFHSANIQNGFRPSLWMHVIGDPDAPAEQIVDSNGVTKTTKTNKQKFNEDLEGSFVGTKNAGKVFVTWSLLKEAELKFEALPQEMNHELFMELERVTTKSIVQAMGVPNILANIEVAGKLGATNEITNSVALMNGNTEQMRTAREEIWQMIAPLMDIPATPSKILNFEYNVSQSSGF